MRLHNRLGNTAGMLLMLALPAQAVFAASFANGARAYDSGDYQTAFTEWHALAKAGDPAAQIAIASLYSGGTGRPIDLAMAASWYRRAAEQGDAVAQMNLGEMYENGWGVTRNKRKAYIWYHRAAILGRDWAAEQRDKLAKNMAAEALADARERLRNTQ